MTGIILCGGQSSRMGSDKGLLKLETGTWAMAAYNKLSDLHIPVKVSVNASQYPNYSTVFPATDLIVDDTSLELKGPLLGTLSAHGRYPSEDLFLLACDMPLMQSFLLKELLEASRLHPQRDAFVFTNDDEPEPLCAIYRSSVLAGVLSLHRSRQLIKHSMKFMLDHIDVFRIPLSSSHKELFRNFNAHAELNGL
jgi:molybdopterin-guanine dinucleotide biosynthesis protein A